MPPNDWSSLLKNKGTGFSGILSLADDEWRKGTVQERISHSLVRGIDSHVEQDMEEARKES